MLAIETKYRKLMTQFILKSFESSANAATLAGQPASLFACALANANGLTNELYFGPLR